MLGIYVPFKIVKLVSTSGIKGNPQSHCNCHSFNFKSALAWSHIRLICSNHTLFMVTIIKCINGFYTNVVMIHIRYTVIAFTHTHTLLI